jgi:NADH-quinone oxidoreductase subunit C
LEPLQIAERIKEKFPDAVLSIGEYRGQAAVVIKKEDIVDVCRWLHDDSETNMRLLKDICGVDYFGKKEPRFGSTTILRRICAS